MIFYYFRVRGCFLAVCERLNEEFYKVLKSCDAHSHEYVERLKDEEKVMAVLQKAQKILEKSQTPSEMCRIYLQQIDHIYFKFDSQVIKQKNVRKLLYFKLTFLNDDKLCPAVSSRFLICDEIH